MLENRPWGCYEILFEDETYKVKKLIINPNKRLSLQTHEHRSEHWVVVKGTIKVRIGDNEQILTKNESAYVPRKMLHRIENEGFEESIVVETQVGDYLGEDDIVRYEDDYGRNKE